MAVTLPDACHGKVVWVSESRSLLGSDAKVLLWRSVCCSPLWPALRSVRMPLRRPPSPEMASRFLELALWNDAVSP